MAKHQEHIVCIKSKLVEHHKGGFVDYELKASELMFGARFKLEQDPDFRQVLPVAVFTHKGKVWLYERTSSGGEARLHHSHAIAIGGHWDLDDIVSVDSVINLEQSISKAMQRELDEEVCLASKIISSRKLPKMICADDTEVDRVHVAVVTLHELDGERVESAEDQLKPLGFFTPQELLKGDFNLETWARIICEMLVDEQSNA